MVSTEYQRETSEFDGTFNFFSEFSTEILHLLEIEKPHLLFRRVQCRINFILAGNVPFIFNIHSLYFQCFGKACITYCMRSEIHSQFRLAETCGSTDNIYLMIHKKYPLFQIKYNFILYNIGCLCNDL